MVLVTVLMPVYNTESFLTEAIDSILHQTFTNFEFLIINDGSTDNSEQIIMSYSDLRIRYVKNQKNIGLVDTLNLGLELATGKYIARMDADDISLAQRLQKQVTFMDTNTDVGVCGTAYQYFGDSQTLEILPQDHKKAFTHLSYTSSIGHPTSMIRKEVLDLHNFRYQNEYQYAADYALWFQISLVSRIVSLNEVLLKYRWHNLNMSKHDSSRKKASGKVRILWFETVLKRSLSQSQKFYLEQSVLTAEALGEVRDLFLSILEHNNSTFVDQAYFGKLYIRDFELQTINKFHFKGLINRLLDSKIRKWSSVTNLGLISYFLKNKHPVFVLFFNKFS